MNLVRSGIILAVYLFVLIIAYLVISSPFDDIMNDFDNLNLTNSDGSVERGTGYGRTVFDIIFAVLAIIPIIWFIVLCFSREPDWRFRQ